MVRHDDAFVPTFTPSVPLRCSAYGDDLNNLASGLSDEQALKKIGSRTTTTGKIMAIIMVGGAAALGWNYMQTSKAYESRMDGIQAAGALEGESMLSALRTELKNTEYDDVKERAIRNLAHFKDPQAVPLYIDALDHGGIVRRAAALALAATGLPAGEPAKPKLLKVLPECDARDRPQVVWALAVLKERGAADAILKEFTAGLLQNQPGFDPKVLTEALGIPMLSSPELTGNNEKPVRALVAMALSEAASPEVVAPLVRMIQRADEDPEVIRAAVMGLGRAADPSAAGALFELMQKQPSLRQSVLDALAKSTAAPQLALLLKEAKDPANKRDVVRLLAKTFDARSADALAGLVDDPDEDTRNEASMALAELGDKRAVPPLLVQAGNEDDGIGMDAVDALRLLGVPEAGQPLMDMVEKFPSRKAALLRALGASHFQAAGPMITKELKGDDVGAAAKALGEMPYEPAYKELVGMLKRDPKIDFSRPSVVTEMAYRNRYEAMQALRYFGKPDPAAAKALITIIEDPEDDFRLASAAGATLGQIADAGIYQHMLSRIQDTKLDERIRVAYVEGLWRKPNMDLSTQLLPLLEGDTPAAIKRSAALAIGYAGNPANDAKLIELLDNPASRRDAAIAITLGGSEAGAAKLLEVLPKDKDTEEVLRLSVNSNEDDNFNLLTESMFSSGQIYRRLRVAQILKEGDGKNSYSYVWTQVNARLRSGWEGPAGVSPRFIRETFYKELTGSDAARRAIVAETFAAMNMRGLLLAARDANIQEARNTLLALEHPKQVTL